MTAMNALIEPQGITLSMDTLVSRRDSIKDVVPYYYTQKFEYYPFTKSILCGTGDSSVIQKVMYISRKILCKDVHTFTKIIDDYLFQNDLFSNLETSTIYIFGFDNHLLPHAYAIRSTNNYKIEEVASYNNTKLLLKPTNLATKKYLDKIRDLDSNTLFKKLMRKEKEIDDNKSPKERVGIGGENILISLMPHKDKLISVTNVLDIFDDYDKQYQYCLKHFNN